MILSLVFFRIALTFFFFHCLSFFIYLYLCSLHHSVQQTTLMYINHGTASQSLEQIAAMTKAGNINLVVRWQKMMEVLLGSQVHILAGLGYPQSEQGLQLYNQQLGQLMQNCDPDEVDILQKASRDVWRHCLTKAFDLSLKDAMAASLNIVDARKVMHAVSQKMQSDEFLNELKVRIENAGSEESAKHTIVQQMLVEEAYLSGSPSLIEQHGFEAGEKGYVMLQCAMSDYQADPLIQQYIGGGMQKVLETAGLQGRGPPPQQ
jgi:hypothetical protein